MGGTFRMPKPPATQGRSNIWFGGRPMCRINGRIHAEDRHKVSVLFMKPQAICR
jgi:hypothetical protein